MTTERVKVGALVAKMKRRGFKVAVKYPKRYSVPELWIMQRGRKMVEVAYVHWTNRLEVRPCQIREV